MDTKENILNEAKREFLEKGFEKASLRNIVKNVGMTTGAFYGYFKSKEILFEAIVGEPARVVMDGFNQRQLDFQQIPDDQQLARMGVDSGEWMSEMSDYILEHSDEFKLIITKSQGTKYEHYIHEMAKVESEATQHFIDVLKRQGYQLPRIDEHLSHLLISGFFSSYFEIVVHDMPRDEVQDYIIQLNAFYHAGWSKIMGL